VISLLRVLKAISDESRLRILNLIVAADEICVCDIERTLGFSQTKVSRHLTILKAADLVRDRRQGLWTLYTYVGNNEPSHRMILKGVMENFASQSVFQEDVANLRQAVKKGTCTTYSIIIPGKAPKSIN
jgi:ArsR family transcriptional regulator